GAQHPGNVVALHAVQLGHRGAGLRDPIGRSGQDETDHDEAERKRETGHPSPSALSLTANLPPNCSLPTVLISPKAEGGSLSREPGAAGVSPILCGDGFVGHCVNEFKLLEDELRVLAMRRELSFARCSTRGGCRSPVFPRPCENDQG